MPDAVHAVAYMLWLYLLPSALLSGYNAAAPSDLFVSV
jgi:hypothetical protein